MRARRNTPRLLLKRFAKCTHGSTAAEFAIAASVALALIFAIVDVGRAFIVNGLLSDAARQISRENQVRETPYSSGEFSSAAQVTIALRAAGMMDPSLVTLSTTVYDSFDTLASGTPDNSAPPGGNPDQIVKYRLAYTMNYYTPFVGLLMDSAQFNHVAEIIVYNEPEVPS